MYRFKFSSLLRLYGLRVYSNEILVAIRLNELLLVESTYSNLNSYYANGNLLAGGLQSHELRLYKLFIAEQVRINGDLPYTSEH